MARADLDEFVTCYNPANRNQRAPTWDEKKNPEGRWRSFTYDELVARDKCSLDVFWLKDESLEDSAQTVVHAVLRVVTGAEQPVRDGEQARRVHFVERGRRRSAPRSRVRGKMGFVV